MAPRCVSRPLTPSLAEREETSAPDLRRERTSSASCARLIRSVAFFTPWKGADMSSAAAITGFRSQREAVNAAATVRCYNDGMDGWMGGWVNVLPVSFSVLRYRGIRASVWKAKGALLLIVGGSFPFFRPCVPAISDFRSAPLLQKDPLMQASSL